RGVHAHPARWRTGGILGTDVTAGEVPVGDADLVRPAGEPGQDARARPAAVERAVRPANGPADAFAVVRASRADAVPRRARAVVEAGIAHGTVGGRRAFDARLAGTGRARALRRVGGGGRRRRPGRRPR